MLMMFIAGRYTKILPKSKPTKATGIPADIMGIPKKHHTINVTTPPMMPIAIDRPICCE